MRIEEAVQARDAEGAKARQDSLCCPVDDDRRLPSVPPAEVVERDYGCGPDSCC